MSLGGKKTTKETSTTNQTQSANTTKDPWAAITPYLTGAGGVAQSAADLFAKNGTASPDLTKAFGDMAGAAQSGAASAAALPGTLTPAQQVTGKYITDVPKVAASSVSVPGAFGGLGEIDPTAAFKGQLSGEVKNTYIDDQLKANTDATQATYANMVADAGDSLARNVLPAIRSGANLSGQYGGSRQGLAEGVAIGDTNKQLTRSADSLAAALAGTNASTLSNAFENAQGRQLTAASGLGDLAVGTATNNANRDLTAQTTNSDNAIDVSKVNVANDADLNKFNSNLTLNNNAQALDAAKTASGLTGDSYAQLIAALTGGAGYEGGQLNDYASIMQALAGLGGTAASTGTTAGTATGTTTAKKKPGLWDWFGNNIELAGNAMTGG